MAWKTLEVHDDSTPAKNFDITGSVRKHNKSKKVGPLVLVIKDEILKHLNEPGKVDVLSFIDVEIGEDQHKGQVRLIRGGRHPVRKVEGKRVRKGVSTIKLAVHYKAPFNATEVVYSKQGETLILTLPRQDLLQSA